MATQERDRRKRSIPTVPHGSSSVNRAAFDQAVKTNLEVILGVFEMDDAGRREALSELLPTATLTDVILTLNQIVRRLQ